MEQGPEPKSALPADAGPRADPTVSSTVLSDEDRLLLVMAYLGPLCLIPLLSRRDPFVRWHARQGLALAFSAAAAVIFLYPFDWLLSRIPFLGRLFFASELLAALGFLVIVGLCIERALAGGKFRVPWLSDLADQD